MSIRAKYRVHYTEYERGWGSRPDGHTDFDSYEEALQHKETFNAKNDKDTVPDWYMIAGDPILVDVGK